MLAVIFPFVYKDFWVYFIRKSRAFFSKQVNMICNYEVENFWSGTASVILQVLLDPSPICLSQNSQWSRRMGAVVQQHVEGHHGLGSRNWAMSQEVPGLSPVSAMNSLLSHPFFIVSRKNRAKSHLQLSLFWAMLQAFSSFSRSGNSSLLALAYRFSPCALFNAGGITLLGHPAEQLHAWYHCWEHFSQPMSIGGRGQPSNYKICDVANPAQELPAATCSGGALQLTAACSASTEGELGELFTTTLRLVMY